MVTAKPGSGTGAGGETACCLGRPRRALTAVTTEARGLAALVVSLVLALVSPARGAPPAAAAQPLPVAVLDTSACFAAVFPHGVFDLARVAWQPFDPAFGDAVRATQTGHPEVLAVQFSDAVVAWNCARGAALRRVVIPVAKGRKSAVYDRLTWHDTSRDDRLHLHIAGRGWVAPLIGDRVLTKAAALSPDGRFAADTRRSGGRKPCTLRLVELATRESTTFPVRGPTRRPCRGPVTRPEARTDFSPTGAYLTASVVRRDPVCGGAVCDTVVVRVDDDHPKVVSSTLGCSARTWSGEHDVLLRGYDGSGFEGRWEDVSGTKAAATKPGGHVPNYMAYVGLRMEEAPRVEAPLTIAWWGDRRLELHLAVDRTDRFLLVDLAGDWHGSRELLGGGAARGREVGLEHFRGILHSLRGLDEEPGGSEPQDD